MAEEVWLTYRGAARRTGRAPRRIREWVYEGLRVGRITEGVEVSYDNARRRVIREDWLMSEKLRRLRANPAHQYRMRRLRQDAPEEFWSRP